MSGGWLDQTAVFLDVIETVEAERQHLITQITEEQAERNGRR